MRVGGRVALAAVTGCLVATGCSGGSSGDPVTLPPTTQTPTSPSVAPSTSTPPTVTVNPDPTPTTTLILPDEHVESVDAFVADFFAALNTAKDTGDLAAFDALYLARCSGCAELRDELTGWLADGGRVEGGDWVILQQSSNQLVDGSAASADTFAYRTEGMLASTDGTTIEISQTAAQWFQFRLLVEHPWIVEDMGRTELNRS